MGGKWVTKATGSTPPVDNFEQMGSQDTILFFQGKNSFGDEIYCYLQLPLKNIDALKSRLASGQRFVPSEFGSVLAAGRGEPTQEIKDEIGEPPFMMYFEPKRLPNMPAGK